MTPFTDDSSFSQICTHHNGPKWEHQPNAGPVLSIVNMAEWHDMLAQINGWFNGLFSKGCQTMTDTSRNGSSDCLSFFFSFFLFLLNGTNLWRPPWINDYWPPSVIVANHNTSSSVCEEWSWISPLTLRSEQTPMPAPGDISNTFTWNEGNLTMW